MISKGKIMSTRLQDFVSRRRFLGLSFTGAASALAASFMGRAAQAQDPTPTPTPPTAASTATEHGAHNGMMSQMLLGQVDHESNGFDPMQMLVDWDYGKVVGETEDGRP